MRTIDRKRLDASDGYREYVTRVAQEVEDKLFPRVTAPGWPIVYVVKQTRHNDGGVSLRLTRINDVWALQDEVTRVHLFHIPAGVTVYEMTSEVYTNMGFYSYL